METFSTHDLEALITRPAKPIASLFVPLDRQQQDIRKDKLRFKKILLEAEGRLLAAGLSPLETGELLEPARKLSVEGSMWRGPGEGLALFMAAEDFRHYRLPSAPHQLLVVSDRAHIKPLLPLVMESDRYFVLALSLNAVRLLEGTRERLQEVRVSAIPQSLSEALKYDQVEKDLGFRSASPAGPGGGGARFFGGTSGPDRWKSRLLDFFHQIDHGLYPILRGERTPLVLAGVEYLFPIYKEANSYAYLLASGIGGSPEKLSPHQLHELAWPVVKPYLEAPRLEAIDRYRRVAGTARSSTELSEVLPAARDGRVDVLFIARDRELWGQFDAETGDLRSLDQGDPHAEDLLNLGAIFSLSASGTVYALRTEDMPSPEPVAALFRY